MPPAAGFIGKFTIFRAAVDGGYLWLALLMALNSVISAPYYLRIVKNMFLKEVERPSPLPTRLGVKVALAISVAAVVVLGVLPEPVVQFLTSVQVWQ